MELLDKGKIRGRIVGGRWRGHEGDCVEALFCHVSIDVSVGGGWVDGGTGVF